MKISTFNVVAPCGLSIRAQTSWPCCSPERCIWSCLCLRISVCVEAHRWCLTDKCDVSFFISQLEYSLSFPVGALRVHQLSLAHKQTCELALCRHLQALWRFRFWLENTMWHSKNTHYLETDLYFPNFCMILIK